MQSSPHVNDLRELKAKLSANKRITACIVMIMKVILDMAIGNDTIGDASSDDDDDDDDNGNRSRFCWLCLSLFTAGQPPMTASLATRLLHHHHHYHCYHYLSQHHHHYYCLSHHYHPGSQHDRSLHPGIQELMGRSDWRKGPTIIIMSPEISVNGSRRRCSGWSG